MAIKTYSGRLTLVGAGEWKDGVNKSSVIEVGGQSIRNVHYSDFLKSYLRVGENVELEVRHSIKGENKLLAALTALAGGGLAVTVVGIPIAIPLLYLAYRNTIIKSITIDGKRYAG